MVTNYRFSFFKWILVFTMVTFDSGNIFAAEPEISVGKLPPVETKAEKAEKTQYIG